MKYIHLLLLVGLTGCAGMMESIMPVEHEQVEKANKDGDVAFLDKACNGEMRLRYDSDKQRACRYAARHKASTGDCSTLVARYESTSKDWNLQKKMATQFAECGYYKQLFEVVVHWGNNDEGAKLLAILEEAGHPVEKEFVKYATENRGPAFMPEGGNTAKFALDNIGKFLVKKGSMGHCELLVNASRGANEDARVWVLPYFRKAKCMSAAKHATEILMSDVPQHRVWACNALSDIGGPGQLKQMAIVAETDSFSQVREEERDGRIWAVKEYSVRDACRSAHGKARLRASASL